VSLKTTLSGLGLGGFFLCAAAGAMATNEVNLNSRAWLGDLHLSDAQLTKIKGAVEQAFDAPIDETFQCGKIRMDCEVRAARQWKIDGIPYRDIVIYIQSVGNASRAVSKKGGSWPTVKIK
jgi:hypothetical protein